jgi:processive 1,2-diacylglycerol beta-glucosyltransferase
MESTGAGHRRAAEAIASALSRGPHDVETELINIVDFMNDTVHQLYQTFRTRVMAEAPHVFGQLYSWADKGPRESESLFDRLLLGLEVSSLRSLADYIRSASCDLAIHTHFFSAEIAAFLRRKQQISLPHVVVTTDYFSHSLWYQHPCELFTVASPDAGTYLQLLGGRQQQVALTGVPVDPAFARERLDRKEVAKDTARRAHQIGAGERHPRILLSTTGTSPEAAARSLEDLSTASRPLQITVLAGGSSERKQALDAVEAGERHLVNILGSRDDMPELLAAADVAIGKAGGLTCSEAMAVGCPMAFLKPRPDQEEQNADFLLERGAALRVFRSSLLGPKMDELFSDIDRWAELRATAYGLGRPNAASEIANRSLQLLLERDIAKDQASTLHHRTTISSKHKSIRKDNMNSTRKEKLETLSSLIRDFNNGMLVTIGQEGAMHARPMAIASHQEPATLWFITAGASEKVDEVARDSRAAVTLQKGQCYVALSGNASFVLDRAKLRELWNPLADIWFDQGHRDPRALLLRFEAEHGEYWDGTGLKGLKFIAKVTRAMLGDKTIDQASDPREHGHVNIAP